jgi:hypothetical protein
MDLRLRFMVQCGGTRLTGIITGNDAGILFILYGKIAGLSIRSQKRAAGADP